MATREMISALAKAENETTGQGPIAGGAAATAQSVADKQHNLAAKIEEVINKPAEEITQEDASELQSCQDRALGIDARTRGGLLSETQKQANLNKARESQDEEETDRQE